MKEYLIYLFVIIFLIIIYNKNNPSELFDNPDIKNAAQEVFAALEKFSQAKNNALTPQSQSQSASSSKHK